MPKIPPITFKILGKLAISTGLIASGFGIASLLKGDAPVQIKEVFKTEESPNVKDEEKILNKASAEKKGKHILYKQQSFIVEELKGKEGNLLYDHFLGSETDAVYYILKSDKTRIRVKASKPSKPNKGIYEGWDLYKFTWGGEWKCSNGKDNYVKTWYGYCYPDPKSEKQNCKNIPNGWTKTKLN